MLDISKNNRTKQIFNNFLGFSTIWKVERIFVKQLSQLKNFFQRWYKQRFSAFTTITVSLIVQAVVQLVQVFSKT